MLPLKNQGAFYIWGGVVCAKIYGKLCVTATDLSYYSLLCFPLENYKQKGFIWKQHGLMAIRRSVSFWQGSANENLFSGINASHDGWGYADQCQDLSCCEDTEALNYVRQQISPNICSSRVLLVNWLCFWTLIYHDAKYRQPFALLTVITPLFLEHKRIVVHIIPAPVFNGISPRINLYG